MKSHLLLIAVCLMASVSSQAQTPASTAAPSQTVAVPAGTTEGEVRKVDKDAQKLTLRHGPIVNLDMPAMTMVFRVADATMLDRVKPGDKVRFKAENVGGQYTVTAIEPLK
jgi:Cu(I)/Ag(I) efflux system protein CusF